MLNEINPNWNALRENHEIAHLRADICIGSPQSFTLDEKRQICEDLDSTAEAIDAAIREEFAAMPAFAQARMLELLSAADPGNMDFWNELLGLDMPDAPDELLQPVG